MTISNIKGTSIGKLSTSTKQIRTKLSLSTTQKSIDENSKKLQSHHVHAHKNNFKIEGNKASQSSNKQRFSKLTINRKHYEEQRRRKKSYQYKKLSQVYQPINNHQHNRRHHHHRHLHGHHHQHQHRNNNHRHKLKKDKHSRTQIKLPEVKKTKAMRHGQVHTQKKSMIAMSKHSQSTATLSSSIERNTKLLPSIQPMKYGSLKQSKTKSRFWRRKLPPVASKK